MNRQSLLLLVCFSLFQNLNWQYVQGDERNKAKISRVECLNVDPEYIANNASCRVKAVRRDLYAMNIQLAVIKPMDNLMVNLKLFKKANTFKPFLIDLQENFCNYLGKKHVATVMKIIGGIFLPYSNLNTSCPLMGIIWIKDMPLNPNDLPSIWPSGEYRLDSKIMRSSKLLITIRVEFVLQEKMLKLP